MVHTDQAHPRLSISLILSNPSCLLPQPGRNATAILHFEVDVDSFLILIFESCERYKESISRSTRGFKEQLLARNNSVKELSKGVQREMNAGIAGVARMFERLDLTPKKPGAPSPVSGHSGGETSNFSFKGKGVLENVIVHSCSNSGRVADESSDAPSRQSCYGRPS